MRMKQVNINTVNMDTLGFPGGSVGKESICSAAELGLITVLGRSPADLQYSCLENSTNRGAWWATVHKVIKSRTRLSDSLSLFYFCFSVGGAIAQVFGIST